MIKKTIFNSLVLATLLFSCLQLDAMRRPQVFPFDKVVPTRISDGITNLKNATTKRVSTQNVGRHIVRYKLLGTTNSFNTKTRGTTKVYLIQLPCIAQGPIETKLNTEGLCGSCSFENSLILAQKDLDLKKAIRELNSGIQRARIKNRARKFEDWVNSGIVQQAWYEKQTGRKIDSTAWLYHYRTEMENLYPITFLQSNWFNTGRIGRSTYPEVFMINVSGMFAQGGHYITMKIEKTKDGDFAILFADSYYPKIIESSGFSYNKYMEVFKNVIATFGQTLDIYKVIKIRKKPIKIVSFKKAVKKPVTQPKDTSFSTFRARAATKPAQKTKTRFTRTRTSATPDQRKLLENAIANAKRGRYTAIKPRDFPRKASLVRQFNTELSRIKSGKKDYRTIEKLKKDILR